LRVAAYEDSRQQDSSPGFWIRAISSEVSALTQTHLPRLLSTVNTDPPTAFSINHWCNLWQTVCSSLNTLQSNN